MKNIIAQNEQPARLDKVLATLLSISRSQAAKIIKEGDVTVDGMSGSAKTQVTAGQNISYNETMLAETKVSDEAPALDILFEDDQVIVVNKLAGLLVHPTESSHEPTLTQALVQYDPAIKDVGENPDRPGIVHRLDKAASGVMIIAKTRDAFENLKAAFASRQVKKHYMVLVSGVLDDNEGTIDFPIERSKSHGRMAAKPHSQGGREAVTHFDVLERFHHHTLLDVTIETGRTHQIRAHMFAIGHPVVGDTLYKQKKGKSADIGRLFLHASSLTVTFPSGEERTFEAPLPSELKNMLEKLPKN